MSRALLSDIPVSRVCLRKHRFCTLANQSPLGLLSKSSDIFIYKSSIFDNFSYNSDWIRLKEESHTHLGFLDVSKTQTELTFNRSMSLYHI